MNTFLLGAFLAGIINATQSVIMGRLTKMGGLQLAIFSLSLAQAVVPALMLYQGKEPIAADWRTPVLGGIIAGLMGTAVLVLNGRAVSSLGAGTALVAITAGLLITSVIADHFGLTGTVKSALDPVRLGGVALVLAGVWMISSR